MSATSTEGFLRPEADRRERTIEVFVFILLILPSVVLSFLGLTPARAGFTFIALSTMLRDIGLVALVLFLVWRDGEPVYHIGWNLKRWWLEILIGVGLFIPTTIVAGLITQSLGGLGLPVSRSPLLQSLVPSGAFQFALGFVLVVVVALAEETVFRGYLIDRFTTVSGNVAGGVALSSIIFALGHGYEGVIGVIVVGFLGVVFALVFVWRRSLVAPIVMHFLQDAIGILVIPLLLRK